MAPYVAAAVVFVAAASVTLWFARAMAATMPMPGGWRMSMMWMRMPGQSWPAAAAVFVLMWAAMMVAMMLPSTLPMLLLYRRVVAFRAERHLGGKMVLVGVGYFAVWTLFGAAAYALGIAMTQAAMRWLAVSRAMPLLVGAALIVAGIYQLTPWKTACLAHCRDPLTYVADHIHGGAFRFGAHHGAFCAACCWGLMLIQLALGVMNLWVMVGVAAAIAAEKLLPRGFRVAQALGIVAIAGGALLIVRPLA
jgi:predicted metal-binding membrane protein